MRKLLVILLVMSLCVIGCSVKRKTKEVERVEVVSETQLSNDSVADVKVQRSSYDWLNNYTSNESLLSKLGLVFNGTTNEDKGSFSIQETDKGLQVDIQGSLQMALDKTHSKDESVSKSELISLMDSIMSAKLVQYKTERSDVVVDSFKMDLDKESKGFQFGAYLTGFGVVCFVLLIAWLGWRFKVIDRLKSI